MQAEPEAEMPFPMSADGEHGRKALETFLLTPALPSVVHCATAPHNCHQATQYQLYCNFYFTPINLMASTVTLTCMTFTHRYRKIKKLKTKEYLMIKTESTDKIIFFEIWI